MKRRKILQVLSLLMPLSIGALGKFSLAAEAKKHVAITAIVEHPALDQARQGLCKS